MKISVIIAIFHMTIGILIKGSNAVYFKRWPDLFFEVMTGLVILLGLFGWMDFLIYGKWFRELNIDDKTLVNESELYDKLGQDLDASPEYKGDWQNQHTPSVIAIMINTIFGFGSIPEEQKDFVPVVGEDQEQQYRIAVGLLITVIIMIPIMLFIKPCFFRKQVSPEESASEIELQNGASRGSNSSSDSFSQKGKRNITSIE